MSNYYEYRDVGVKIAHRLMNMNGWKVFGYKPNNSDAMTDYWDPASWDGIAIKNGYTFVFNKSYEEKEKHYKILKKSKRDTYESNISENNEIKKKISKLKNMTMEKGASQQEEDTAKNIIKKLERKLYDNKDVDSETNNELCENVVVPAHLANPPRCNWHIEKDGIIIAKGSGLLKFYGVYDLTNERCQQDWQNFNNLTKEEWISKNKYNHYYNYNVDLNAVYDRKKDKFLLLEKFNQFIFKIDTTCGGMVGDENEFYVYEKVKVTEYKKENKAIKTENGSIKNGQCFKLISNFNHGCYSGLVYRINETKFTTKNGEVVTSFTGWKLNGKLTKECHGQANKNNSFYIDKVHFMKWIEKGSIVWCDIVEENIPYEVEKVVKKKKNANKKRNNNGNDNSNSPDNMKEINVTFTIKEDVDTRDNSKLWVVKINQKISRDEYLKVNEFMRGIGGYYSRFKHGFIFKEDVTNKIKLA